MRSSIFTQIKKELLIEFRGKTLFLLVISFALCSVVAISMALGGSIPHPLVQALLYWLLLFFCAMNSLAHVFVREKEQRTALLLQLHVGPLVVFSAKYLYNFFVLLVMQLIITPLFILFLQMSIEAPLSFLLVAASGSLALVSAVTILAAITAEAGGKGALFTIISFPIVMPVLWIAIKATNASLEGTAPVLMPVLFLVSFSLMLSLLSLALFPSIWHEG